VVVLIFLVTSCEAYPKHSFHLLTVSRDPSCNYQLSGPEVQLYWEGMEVLSKHISIWPHHADLLRHGNKSTYVNQLKEIAEEVTHTKYPNMESAEDPLSFIEMESKEIILTRNYSSSLEHTFTILTGNTTFETLVKEEAAIAQEQYGYFEDWIKPQWFLMHSIESKAFGELRAFFVGGHLIYTLQVIDAEGGQMIMDAALINPLSLLK
jgi:hypothetical protein